MLRWLFSFRLTEISAITKNDIVLASGKTIPIGDQYRTQINRKHIDGNLVSRSN